MKILIRDSSILTMDSKKPFIGKGYIYIDQGKIVALGDGEPQPELEFADYIINDRFIATLPGFTVGIGDIIKYFFRFIEAKNIKEIIEMLSKSDLYALVEVVLTSLTANGATSIITLLYNPDPKILSAIVAAASSSWIRTRIMILLDGFKDSSSIENEIRNALKSSKDPEAITKNIVSFGLYVIDEKSIKKMIDIVNSIDVFVYTDATIQQKLHRVFPDIENRKYIIINPTNPHTRCIFSDAASWRYNCGISPYDSMLLNPKKLLQETYRVIDNAEESVLIVSSYNSINHIISPGIIKENSIADIIILDFGEPPYGPIPMTRNAIISEIIDSNFIVKTAIIGGEIVLDNGVLLTISRESIKKAQSIVEDFIKL